MPVEFSRIAVVVPAAGAGRRFGAERPKQYSTVAGKAVLDYTLEVLLACGPAEIVLVVAPADERWRGLDGAHAVRVVSGGASRSASVLAGLESVTAEWAMVHDAARPCVRPEQIRQLARDVDEVAGGLLAVPMSDTVKRAEGRRVSATVDRTNLWCAQTPQLFPTGTLIRALRGARDVTDESSAIEALGLAPQLVAGSPDNIKVTVPDDIALCADILARQGRTAQGGTGARTGASS